MGHAGGQPAAPRSNPAGVGAGELRDRAEGRRSRRAGRLRRLSAALFILSILAHELAHAVASRARGVPVAGITLYMLGGATEATGEVKSAGDEFLAAVVGPATTAGLWLLFRTLHGAWGSTLPH